jgi:type I restriction enzyme S subunit
MSNWRETTLAGACSRVDYGYTASASDDPELPRFLRITDIAGPHLDWSTVPGCAIDDAKLARYAVTDGDIVVARTGATVGYAKRIRNHPTAVFASYLVRFRPAKGVVPAFLGAVVESQNYKAWVQRNAGGAAQPNASAKLLGAFPLRLPDEGTQQRVGLISDALDDLIENNRRRVEQLEEMARAIYREWFVHFRYPGHESVSVVDSPVGPIPDGWELMAASKALAINPRVKLDRSAQHPFITMGDLSDRGMVCSPSEEKVGNSGAKFVNGDTLFARITPCLENGKTGFVQCLEEGQAGRGSTEFVVLRGIAVGAAYTYCLARSEAFRAHAIQSMSGASGRQRVRNECFDSFLLPVPPLALVTEFERLAAPLFKTVRSLSVQATTLAAVRDLLLPKLVTGQIDVSSLDLDALVEGSVA